SYKCIATAFKATSLRYHRESCSHSPLFFLTVRHRPRQSSMQSLIPHKGDHMTTFRITICAVLALALLSLTGSAADLTDSLKAGKADLKSAGALAFGPDGVLFVGDSMGGMIFALDTQDRTPSQAAAVEVQDLTTKIAAMAGTTADQIQVNDIAVNPI